MRRKITVFCLVVAFVTSVVFANGLYNISYQVPKYYHLNYVADHCAGIPSEHASNIADHITYDASGGGAVMIYDVIPNETGPAAFVAAYTSPIDDFLCVRGIGCPIGPDLRNDCLEQSN